MERTFIEILFEMGLPKEELVGLTEEQLKEKWMAQFTWYPEEG